MDRKEKLLQAIAKIPQEDYPVRSRVHQLCLGRNEGIACYVKREDELGALISGTKVRKYRTQVALIKKRGYQSVALVGGRYSNHLLGLSSLLIENEIEPTLFLPETKEDKIVGNALLLHLLVPEKNIRLISHDRWHEVETIARVSHECVIPQGGHLEDCLGGLLTLSLDVLRNEEEHNTHFKEIFIDSGSGLTASALIASFGYLQREIKIHVMLAAGTPKTFLETVKETKKALEILLDEPIESLATFNTHQPLSAKSFGATNSATFQTIRDVAQKEGFFVDPIYSSKLYPLLEEKVRLKSVASPLLFIHSGGLYSLSGFQPHLSASLPR